MSSPASSACHRCGAALALDRRIGRREVCAGCGVDVHVCKNCGFYSAGAYNDCREPNADRVVDKESSNFCEYFAVVASSRGVAPGGQGGDRARQALDALFRKS
jgi:hypothetical protein